MNGAGSCSNNSFKYENYWFSGRPSITISRADIENDLYKGNKSPNFLSACSSYLQLRLQDRLESSNLLENNSVLTFANSCIELKNIGNYSRHFEQEISKTQVNKLSIDQILPKPKISRTNILYRAFVNNIRNKLMKIRNFLVKPKIKSSDLEIKKSKKSLKLVTKSTQTDICLKKFKHIKKPSSTILKGRSSRMSVPEEVKEYHSWKEKSSNEMTKRIYKCPMAKCNSCLEVVETKVETKKFTKMRRQSSKLSVLNEDRESEDEFESYWSQVKLRNSSRF